MIICEYPVYPSKEFKIELPVNYKILTIKLQNGLPYIWILIDKKAKTFVNKRFVVFPTGVETDYDFETFENLEYIDSFQPENNLIFHVFYWKYDI